MLSKQAMTNPSNLTVDNATSQGERNSDNSESNDESSPEVVENVEDLIEQDPLIMLFGDHARARILMALLDAYPQPMNPTAIVEQAQVSRQSWYRHKDQLLQTGMVKEAAKAGNSPLYSLADPDDDPRVEWLQKLRDWTGAFRRDGRLPESATN